MTHEQHAYLDGPFDPTKQPWLLSNQRRLGIAGAY